MKQSTKRKIAKEVIIFFCSATLIGLVWTIFWLISNYNIRKTENIQKQIVSCNHSVDSIKSTFPRLKTFHDLITGKVPVKYLIEEKYIPTIDEIRGTEHEQERAKNIRQLYKLLKTSKFKFSVDSYIPDFPTFKDDIIKELESDSSSKKYLNKIYSFLKTKKYLTSEFEEFKFSLDALPLPQKYETWKSYKDKVKKRDKLKAKLKVIKEKIYSAAELGNIAIWTSLIVLIIVYPFRFLILLLRWAIRTLKQK